MKRINYNQLRARECLYIRLMYTTQTFQLHSFEQLLIFDSFRSSVQVEFQQKMMLELGMLEKDIQKLAEAEQRTEV